MLTEFTNNILILSCLIKPFKEIERNLNSQFQMIFSIVLYLNMILNSMSSL